MGKIGLDRKNKIESKDLLKCPVLERLSPLKMTGGQNFLLVGICKKRGLNTYNCLKNIVRPRKNWNCFGFFHFLMCGHFPFLVGLSSTLGWEERSSYFACYFKIVLRMFLVSYNMLLL